MIDDALEGCRQIKELSMSLERKTDSDAFNLALESAIARSKEMIKLKKEVKKLGLKIEQSKTEMIKWIIATSIAVVTVIVSAVGLLIKIIK